MFILRFSVVRRDDVQCKQLHGSLLDLKILIAYSIMDERKTTIGEYRRLWTTNNMIGLSTVKKFLLTLASFCADTEVNSRMRTYFANFSRYFQVVHNRQ